MVSDEEAHRTVRRGRWFVIRPMLPEVGNGGGEAGDGVGCLEDAYSSEDDVMSIDKTTAMLRAQRLMLEDNAEAMMELLR